MSFFDSMFGKMGHRHIRQLAKDCSKLIIKASMSEYKQLNNPYLTDSALNLLIKHNQYSLMKEKTYENLKDKFSDFFNFYIVRNIRRDLDWLSGENCTIDEEVERYWPVFMATKQGITQIIKEK